MLLVLGVRARMLHDHRCSRTEDPPARRDLLQQADATPLSKDSLAAFRLESLPRLAFFSLDPWHPAGFLLSETS
jgi:hypothetical protein